MSQSPLSPLKKPIQNQLQTLHLALDVLEYISCQISRPVQLAEINKALGISKSKIYRILKTLIERGYVQKDTRTNNYSLDINTWLLSRSISDITMLVEIVKPILDELCECIHETTFLSVLHKKTVLYIYTKMSSNPTLAYLETGSSVPIHATASGKLLLSYQSPSYFDELINQGLEKCTEHTLVDRDSLLKELEIIQNRGYSTESEEWSLGFSAVATAIPVFSTDRVAAIGVFLPFSRADNVKLDELVHRMIDTKASILDIGKTIKERVLKSKFLIDQSIRL